MSHMNEVKTSVGQNDTLPFLPFDLKDLFQLIKSVQFFQFSDWIDFFNSSTVMAAVPLFMTTIPPA